MIPLLVTFVVLGLAVGSFLNVLIDRLPAGESIVRGASHCSSCAHLLAPVDLVPVFKADGTPSGEMFEVEDRTLARFDIIRRKASGGTSVFGIWAGLNDSTEDLGFVLSWSTGAQ